ncbi:MAG: glycerophosphodiester phosphodiesterase [Weeksellaceae bacterium]
MSFGCYSPKIIAHRGYWKAASGAQNSLESIKKADAHKFYGSEFDIQITKDSIPIVFHDNYINDIKIEDLSFVEIKDEKLSNGENIPSLEDYLKTAKSLKNIRLIAELKSQSSPELEGLLVNETIELISKYHLQNNTDYISFSAHICDLIKKKVPTAHVQYLNGDLSPIQIKERGWDGLDYNYKILLNNQNWIKEAHDLGLSTNAWTVNTVQDIEALKKLKIQMITTDEPLKLKD